MCDIRLAKNCENQDGQNDMQTENFLFAPSMLAIPLKRTDMGSL